MDLKYGVKDIQTAGYNGKRTVVQFSYYSWIIKY